MAIEAPAGKHRRTNLKIYIAFCIGAAAFFAYDGYLSKYEWSGRHSFYEKHVKDGQPDETIIFNRISPAFLGAGAVVFAVMLSILKSRKIMADENRLIISEKEKINYDSIQKIDKTDFDSKGLFVITYKNEAGKKINRKLSDRKYDNLAAILDHLVAKIS